MNQQYTPVEIVNNPMLTKLITPDALVEVARDFDARKSDTVVDVGAGLSINKQVAFGNVGPTDLSPNALTLLGMKLGYLTDGSQARLPVDWMRKSATAHEFDTILNSRFAMVKEKGGWNYLARYYNGDGNTPAVIRAVLGADYPAFGNAGVYENTLMVEALAVALKQFGGEVSFRRCKLTPDTVSIRVFTRTLEPEQIGSKYSSSYAVGWVLGNNETGNGGFSIHPAIKRTSCDNSIVLLEDGGASYSHIGAKVKFTEAIEKALVEMVPAAMNGVRQIVRAESMPIDFKQVMRDLESKFGWTDRKGNFKTTKAQELHDAVLIGTEGDTETLMGAINGITYAAHRVEQPEDDQLAMELFAGALLSRVKVS